ncbi:MAG: hypothetical protein RLZZ519_571 [Bacteroidota bacterium]
MRRSIFILLTILPCFLLAQNTWSLDLPGVGNVEQAVATYDGGVVVVTNQPNKIMKIDESGALLWSYVIDNGVLGLFISATETADHGIVAFGSVPDYSSTYVIKLDAQGNRLWEKNYSTTFGGLTAIWVCPTHADGGFLFGGGECGLKFYATRCDANGAVQWTHQYYGLGGGGINGYLSSMVQTDGGGYLTTFSNYDAPDQDWGLMKIDGSGNFEWANVQDEVVYNDLVKATVATKSGGIAVLGVSFNTQLPNGNQQNMTLATFDSTGNRLSYHVYDYPESIQPEALVETNDGGFIFTGIVASTLRTILVRTDSQGVVLWQKAGTGYAWQFSSGLALAPNEMVYMAGIDETNWTFLNKISVASGDGLCSADTIELTITSPQPPIAAITPNLYIGTVTPITVADISHQESQQPTLLCSKVANDLPVSQLVLNVHPNPFSSNLKVELGPAMPLEGRLKVHSVLGREVYACTVERGTSMMELNLPHLEPGIYLLTVQCGNEIQKMKLIHR